MVIYTDTVNLYQMADICFIMHDMNIHNSHICACQLNSSLLLWFIVVMLVSKCNQFMNI